MILNTYLVGSIITQTRAISCDWNRKIWSNISKVICYKEQKEVQIKQTHFSDDIGERVLALWFWVSFVYKVGQQSV